jgi:signal transduction histidine kinase
MSLRTRLVLTTMAVAVPLAAILFVLAERSRHAVMDERLETTLASAPCPANVGTGVDQPPRGPGGRGGGGRGGRGGRSGGLGGPGGRGGPPVDVFAYSSTWDLVTPDGRGPAFPDDLRSEVLTTGRAAGTWSNEDGRGRQLAMQVTTADAACAFLLARIRPRAGEIRDQLVALGSIILTVFVAVLVAAGPTVSRIHRLAVEVKSSAASRYEHPVAESGSAEVVALARAFNDAGRDIRAHVDRVEAREAALRDFVANTTHDVAVPLTVLQSHLSALEQSVAYDAEAGHVRLAMLEAHYMGSLLRNLGAAGRLEGGVPLQPIDFDLNALVERVVARHTPLARAAQVTLDVAVPGTSTMVSADHTLLEQAVGNLIDNAVSYNQAGGHVAVVLDHDPESADRFLLSVSDDGHGVADTDLPNLATRRFRSDAARSRQPGGQGLGLAIVGEVVTALGWSLSFHRLEPNGLRATIAGARKL